MKKYRLFLSILLVFCTIFATSAVAFAAPKANENSSVQISKVVSGKEAEDLWAKAVAQGEKEGESVVVLNIDKPKMMPRTYSVATASTYAGAVNFSCSYDRYFASSGLWTFGAVYNLDSYGSDVIRVSDKRYTLLDQRRTCAANYTIVYKPGTYEYMKTYYVEFNAKSNSGKILSSL